MTTRYIRPVPRPTFTIPTIPTIPSGPITHRPLAR